MPFVYHGEPINIDRSSKRKDDSIHKIMLQSIIAVYHSSASLRLRILPTAFNEPVIDKADSSKFLVLHATEELGLTWFEVEYWLDEIAKKHRFYTNSTCSDFIDERRRCYKQPTRKVMGGLAGTCEGYFSTHVTCPRNIVRR